MGCDGALNAQIEDYYNFIDSRTLYDWGFENFSYRTLLTTNEVVERQEVELADGDAVAMLKPADQIRALVPNELSDESIRRDVVLYNETLQAPLSAGAVLGEVRIWAGGELLGSTRLINSSAIELSRNAFLTQRLAEIVSRPWVIGILAVLLLFAILYIILVSRYRRLRKMHLKARKRAEQQRREQEKARPTRIEYDLQNPADRFDFSADMSEFFDEEKKGTDAKAKPPQ